MADLVIDEWLWADLTGQNTERSRREAFLLLQCILARCDRIIAVKSSPFERKAFALWGKEDVWSRRIAKFYRNNFWYNSAKCVLLEPSALRELPVTLANEVNADDRYLVQAYLTAGAEVVVTTDGALKSALDRHGIRCELRDPFLTSYLQEQANG